jgi:hypothetical protein
MKRGSALSLVLAAVLGGALTACEWTIANDHGAGEGASGGRGYGSGAGPASGAACDAPGSPPGAPCPSPASGGCGAQVDRHKELLVVNRSVLDDHRARNDVAGAPWSFRSRLEELAGGAGGAGGAPALARAWLDTWSTVTSVGPDAAPVTPRPNAASALTSPWLALAPAGSTDLPLDRAPFRLIAIVNRLDLRARDCAGPAGELRFVYAATDPKTGAALAMTVAVEIPYPDTAPPDAWARRWHALGALPFGAEYNEALAALTSDVTAHARREDVRVRTDEAALSDTGFDWELRDFGLDAGGRLALLPLAQTPRMDLERSASLDAWAEGASGAIADGTFVLPGAFQAGSAPIPYASFTWGSTAMSEPTRRALSLATCNGCHGGERGADTLSFQHLAAPDAPYYGVGDGETRVSRYLDNGTGQGDELSRRATSLARALCAACAAPREPSDAEDAGDASDAGNAGNAGSPGDASAPGYPADPADACATP